MGEPLITYTDDGRGAEVRLGPPCDVGQVRAHPNYPGEAVTVGPRTETMWRINYHAGGHAVLPEETIRAVYPDVITPGEAA